MKYTHKQRTWIVPILAFWSLIVVACSCSLLNRTGNISSSNEPPASADDATTEPLPEAYFESGGGTFDLNDPAAGLADLSSYRSTLTLSFDGKRNGKEEQWSRTFEMTASQQGTVFHQVVIQATGQADGQPLIGQYHAEMAGTHYKQTAGAACEAAVMGPDATPLAEIWEPAGMLSTLRGADEAGTEEVSGIAAKHYTFDARALGLSGLGSGTGEAWVASDGGYLLKYTLSFEGNEEYFGEGEGVTGTLTWEYELHDVNQAVVLDLPEGCPYGRVDAPLMADAIEINETPGITTYMTSSRPDEVIAFYEEQIPKAGWEVSREATRSEGGDAVTFAQEKSQLTVLAFPVEGGTNVWLMLQDQLEPLPGG